MTSEKRTTRLFDDDGLPVTAGDRIRFSYGIPTRKVTAHVIGFNGRLYGTAKGHTPSVFNLRSLRRYVGGWWRV